jgi:hypothetical protein
MLDASQPQPSTEAILTSLINEVAALSDGIVLVLDDYHMIELSSVDDAITFLLEHLPPVLHVVLVTRVDPQLSLSRLRACDQITELRAMDLRFTASEVAGSSPAPATGKGTHRECLFVLIVILGVKSTFVFPHSARTKSQHRQLSPGQLIRKRF